jgi:hypothetical protein
MLFIGWSHSDLKSKPKVTKAKQVFMFQGQPVNEIVVLNLYERQAIKSSSSSDDVGPNTGVLLVQIQKMTDKLLADSRQVNLVGLTGVRDFLWQMSLSHVAERINLPLDWFEKQTNFIEFCSQDVQSIVSSCDIDGVTFDADRRGSAVQDIRSLLLCYDVLKLKEF